jgi:hypothetical protein
LHRVLDRHAPTAAIAEQPRKRRLIYRRGDGQHLTDPGQHQGAERVIDHRFVVHRQQLLAQRLGDRVQPGDAAAGQDDALAANGVLIRAEFGSYLASRSAEALRNTALEIMLFLLKVSA